VVKLSIKVKVKPLVAEEEAPEEEEEPWQLVEKEEEEKVEDLECN
jgi:hypothetical protein